MKPLAVVPAGLRLVAPSPTQGTFLAFAGRIA